MNKICTSIEQSKKLMELGIDVKTADMWWNFYSVTTDDTTPQIIHLDTPWVGSFNWANKPDNIPAWSLAALLEVLNFPSLIQEKENQWEVCVFDHDNDGYIEKTASNSVDACYEMIIKLHELKML